jgi:hypothetical protein
MLYPFLINIHLTFLPQYAGMISPFDTYTIVLSRPCVSHSPLTVHFRPVARVILWSSILKLIVCI